MTVETTRNIDEEVSLGLVVDTDFRLAAAKPRFPLFPPASAERKCVSQTCGVESD
jgi:hypothetical protein